MKALKTGMETQVYFAQGWEGGLAPALNPFTASARQCNLPKASALLFPD